MVGLERAVGRRLDQQALRRRHVQLARRHLIDADREGRDRAAAAQEPPAAPPRDAAGRRPPRQRRRPRARRDERSRPSLNASAPRRREPVTRWGEARRQVIRTGVPSGTTRAIQMMFGVIDADAAVRARRSERVGEARAVATVDRDAPGAAAVVEQHVREGGQVQRPGAEEALRVRLRRASRRSRRGRAAWASPARRSRTGSCAACARSSRRSRGATRG